jgi:hypothetical protein
MCRIITTFIADKKSSLLFIRTTEHLPTTQAAIVLIAIAELIPVTSVPHLALTPASTNGVVQAAPINPHLALLELQCGCVPIVVVGHPSSTSIIAQLNGVMCALHFAILIRVRFPDAAWTPVIVLIVVELDVQTVLFGPEVLAVLGVNADACINMVCSAQEKSEFNELHDGWRVDLPLLSF